jgi:sugar/nucleoside kinase (ribokinase family)
MSAVDLFAIGNALIDQEFKVDDVFLAEQNLQKGTMQLTDGDTQAQLYQNLSNTQEYKGQASGGSAANTTVAFSALGGTAFYACRVGSDDLGQIYLKGLNEAGIQTTEKSISQGVTGTCMVLVSPDSERTMHTYLGITAELTDAQIDFSSLETAKWLYLEGYLSTSETARQAVQHARQIAQSSGVKIALTLSDPAMVQYARAGLDDMIADGVDLLFCNQQEALMYTETNTLDAALTALKKMSKQVVITLSADGALVSTETETFNVSGRTVEAIDANGAGDSFAGAYLYAINSGWSAKQAAELAILVSSEVVSQFGPRLNLAQYPALLQTFTQQGT